MDDKDEFGRAKRWLVRTGTNRHARRKAVKLRRRLACPRSKCRSSRVQGIRFLVPIADTAGFKTTLHAAYTGILCHRCGKRSTVKLAFADGKLGPVKPTVITRPQAVLWAD